MRITVPRSLAAGGGGRRGSSTGRCGGGSAGLLGMNPAPGESTPGPESSAATLAMDTADANKKAARTRGVMSGRGASYPAPPPQIPPCSFPAVGSRRRSNAIEGRSLAAHVPPTRRLAASVTRRPGSESGACVAARLSFDRPPSLHSLRRRFVVGFVRGFTGTTQPSDSSRLPQQLRLLDFLSWPGIAAATAGGMRSPRFRRDPFIRDVASDPGRATVPCVTAPHMLPSAVATASAPRFQGFRGSIPHPK